MFRAFNTYEIKDLIMELKPNKSTIGIPHRCVQLACEHISEALTITVNNHILQGIVPDLLKVSKVIPVDKGGEPTDPSNYRPISILSSFSMILEKLILYTNNLATMWKNCKY
jgi:hypothetical protein